MLAVVQNLSTDLPAGDRIEDFLNESATHHSRGEEGVG